MPERVPEPGDGTRLEFESAGRVYAVWRDDQSSQSAGLPVGAGGETWRQYGQRAPYTWGWLGELFGWDTLANATRLYTQAELDEAVRVGGYEQIGEHRIALGTGMCVIHGEQYRPGPELDRLRRNAGGDHDEG